MINVVSHLLTDINQYTTSKGLLLRRTFCFFPSVAEIMTSTPCSQLDGQAEWS